MAFFFFVILKSCLHIAEFASPNSSFRILKGQNHRDMLLVLTDVLGGKF